MHRLQPEELFLQPCLQLSILRLNALEPVFGALERRIINPANFKAFLRGHQRHKMKRKISQTV
jgi:hypothetical protein